MNKKCSNNQNKVASCIFAEAILGIRGCKDNQEEYYNAKYSDEQQEKLYQVVNEIIDFLNEVERGVMVALFGLEGKRMTRAELAKLKGVSEERIWDIEAVAIRKLRHPRRSRKLEVIINDNVRTAKVCED